MFDRRRATFPIVVLMTLTAVSCPPARTVKYQNAPDGPDPTVAIVAVDTTGGSWPNPPEATTDGTIAIAAGAQTLVFGRGSHTAGIATLKLRLIHDNSVVNVATLKQSGALGSQVENPAMIYASDGVGNAGAQVPFAFTMNDTRYSADIEATDAAGHKRKITVKFAYQPSRSSGGGGGGGVFGGTGGSSSGGTSGGTGGSTGGTGTQCQCPNLADPACGGADGSTCIADSQCRPNMKCIPDPDRPSDRKICRQTMQCPAPTCYKPSQLSYDRDACFGS